jgi:hypothetical protein
MENKKLTLELNIDQANIIMSALGRMPYEAVVGLINEMHKQIQPQLQPQSTETVSRTLPTG